MHSGLDWDQLYTSLLGRKAFG